MSTSISFPQVTKIVDTLGEKGVTSELVQDDLLGKGRLADLAEAAVRGTIPDRETFRKLLGLLVATFRLIIDYTMSLADMITAGGYDWVNPNITEANFPIMMKGTMGASGRGRGPLMRGMGLGKRLRIMASTGPTKVQVRRSMALTSGPVTNCECTIVSGARVMAANSVNSMTFDQSIVWGRVRAMAGMGTGGRVAGLKVTG